MTLQGPPPAVFTSRGWWIVTVTVALSLTYLALQAFALRPYLPPAGLGAHMHGVAVVSGATTDRSFIARPPLLRGQAVDLPVIGDVPPGGPADAAGLRAGDRVVAVSHPTRGRVDLRVLTASDPVGAIRVWRDLYWLGPSGPLALVVAAPDGAERTVALERPAVWRLDRALVAAWLQEQAGLLLQVSAFVLAGLVLLVLRPRDLTAQIVILAFVLCGLAPGGALMGSEAAAPPPLRSLLTVFAWIAGPLSFPILALTVSYFPHRSWLLERHPWTHVLPFVTAAPMLVMSGLTGLFMAGVDALAPAAAWDAAHPGVFFGSFVAALAVNVAAVVDGVFRFRGLHDVNDRRRVKVVVSTMVPATVAYVMKDGVPALALAAGVPLVWPWWLTTLLYLIVLLPAIGVSYVVAVHRVLGPRLVLRRSLQYALARRTVTVATALPAGLLALSLVTERDRSLAEIVSGRPLMYVVLIGLLVGARRKGDKARAWLDRRFFRSEYDAKQVLLSLAGRIPFETDPNELTALVLKHVDTALHPAPAAVLAAGVVEGRLVPVAELHGRLDALPAAGGLATMLRWSTEPLEIFLDDTRSPARRLPPEEIAWLERSNVVLLVPMLTPEGRERTLLGILALGPKRSEEAYTNEDRELLSSIAAQVALGLDVARLRQREAAPPPPAAVDTATVLPSPGGGLVTECPQCGGCDDPGTLTCHADGAPMRLGALPRIVEAKYRVDHVLGRGGMGAVYRAHDMRLDRDVALKVVRADLLHDADARTRFRREAQLVARLQHPAIVSIFDYGSLPDGGLYLVMEYVRGRDLRQVLKQEAPLDPSRVARLMRAVCEAIESAHQQGVLHRDLKPENLLLPAAGAGVKVLDFGVAKLVAGSAGPVTDETLTQAGQPIGTPAYMAPEQLAGAEVTPRTDVFGLAVVTYELLAGELPFGRGPLVDIALRQRHGAPPLSRDGRTYPPDVDAVIAAALAADPAERTPTARAFGEELSRALSG